MKRFLSTFALVLAMVVLPSVSLAAEFRVPQAQSGSADLKQGESARNLYIAGNNVNVSGIAKGDLVAAGNTLNLTGPVDNGLFAAGSSINILGEVGQNARVAGSTINISGNVRGDLMVGGAALTISPESTVGGDLIAGVGTLVLDGPIKGNAKISGADITLNSTINGDVVVYGGNLVLGDSAKIGGNLTYRAPQEAKISKSAVVTGSIDFKKTEAKKYDHSEFAGILGMLGFIGFLMGLALLFVFVYVLPRSSLNLVKRTLASFWTNLGWGFLAAVVTPIGLIILASTVIGMKLAAVIGLLYAGFWTVAAIAATLVIGAQILKWIEKKNDRVDWLTILVGTLAVIILGIVPVLGSLIICAVSLSVFGTLVGYLGRFVKNQR